MAFHLAFGGRFDGAQLVRGCGDHPQRDPMSQASPVDAIADRGRGGGEGGHLQAGPQGLREIDFLIALAQEGRGGVAVSGVLGPSGEVEAAATAMPAVCFKGQGVVERDLGCANIHGGVGGRSMQDGGGQGVGSPSGKCGNEAGNGVRIAVDLARFVHHFEVVLHELHVPAHEAGGGTAFDGVLHGMEPS